MSIESSRNFEICQKTYINFTYLIGRLTRQVVQNIFGSKGFFSEDLSANSMMARYLWSSVCF